MSYPDLYFCRHGQTEWNSVGRFQGQLDSPLTDLGKIHAARQGEILRASIADFSSFEIIASPLGRVRQTVEEALGSLRGVRFDERLMEIDVGELSGKSRSEILMSDPRFDQAGYDGFWSAYFQTEGGETWGQFHDRILAVSQEITKPTIVFAHGIVGFVMRGLFKGISPQEMALQQGGQGCVFHIKDGQENVLA